MRIGLLVFKYSQNVEYWALGANSMQSFWGCISSSFPHWENETSVKYVNQIITKLWVNGSFGFLLQNLKSSVWTWQDHSSTWICSVYNHLVLVSKKERKRFSSSKIHPSSKYQSKVWITNGMTLPLACWTVAKVCLMAFFLPVFHNGQICAIHYR